MTYFDHVIMLREYIDMTGGRSVTYRLTQAEMTRIHGDPDWAVTLAQADIAPERDIYEYSFPENIAQHLFNEAISTIDQVFFLDCDFIDETNTELMSSNTGCEISLKLLDINNEWRGVDVYVENTNGIDYSARGYTPKQIPQTGPATISFDDFFDFMKVYHHPDISELQSSQRWPDIADAVMDQVRVALLNIPEQYNKLKAITSRTIPFSKMSDAGLPNEP
jgi:hypothetical protein